MADEDHKSDEDKKHEEHHDEVKHEEPEKKVEPEKPETIVRDDESFADVLKDVESKTSIKEGVETLVQHIALEVEAKAEQGKTAIEDLADKVHDAASRFAEAVEARLADANQQRYGGERHYGAKRGDDLPGPGADLSDTNWPDNSAAVESAVAHGMDRETAISMTSPGSNT